MSIKYKDSEGNFTEIKIKTKDSLPVGTIVDYDGNTVPDGYEEVEDTNKIYSTEEVVIGKWFDKPLYRKVLNITLPEKALNSDYECADLSSLNIDKLVKLEGLIDATSTQVILNLAYKGNSQYCSCYYVKETKKLRYATNNEQYVNVTAYIILKYTKTTDTEEA